MYGADNLRSTNAISNRDTAVETNDEPLEPDNVIETLSNSDVYRKKWYKNLTDKVSDEDTDEEKLTYFLADFLKIKNEGVISDNAASKMLNSFASYLLAGMKCPRTIGGCRSFVRNKASYVASIYDEVEKIEFDDARILIMPVNKTVKSVVKRNLEYLMPPKDEDDVININLQLHTDGSEVAKSSRLKIWPLNEVIKNLLDKIRIAKSNVILIAIHIFDKTPDFRAFCERFVRDFNVGVQVIFQKVVDHGIQAGTVKFRVKCNMLTDDIPVFRSILNLQSHSCQFGCLHCYREAVTEPSVFGNVEKEDLCQ